MSRKEPRRKGVAAPLTKGIIFTMVTVLATAVLAITIANIGVGDTVDYRARFSSVTGLTAGDDVRIAGVRVGQVDDIAIVDRRVAEVTFSVQSSRDLPKSATAAIKYRNLVGRRYITLGRGAGPINEVLPKGGTIPLEHTQPPLDLTALFNGFKPLFRALSPKDVNNLSNEIVRVLQGEGGTVGSLVSHTASLTTTLAKKDKVIGQVIDNLNSVLDTVNSRGDALGDMITTLQRLVSGLSRDREPIGNAISAISHLTTSTAGLLQPARGPLKQDIVQLGKLSNNLARHTPTIEKFLHNLPVKMNAIGKTTSYGSWLNFYLCSALVSGVRMSDGSTPPDGIHVTDARCQG